VWWRLGEACGARAWRERDGWSLCDTVATRRVLELQVAGNGEGGCRGWKVRMHGMRALVYVPIG
jgi:hypothetical protein